MEGFLYCVIFYIALYEGESCRPGGSRDVPFTGYTSFKFTFPSSTPSTSKSTNSSLRSSSTSGSSSFRPPQLVAVQDSFHPIPASENGTLGNKTRPELLLVTGLGNATTGSSYTTKTGNNASTSLKLSTGVPVSTSSLTTSSAKASSTKSPPSPPPPPFGMKPFGDLDEPKTQGKTQTLHPTTGTVPKSTSAPIFGFGAVDNNASPFGDNGTESFRVESNGKNGNGNGNGESTPTKPSTTKGSLITSTNSIFGFGAGDNNAVPFGNNDGSFGFASNDIDGNGIKPSNNITTSKVGSGTTKGSLVTSTTQKSLNSGNNNGLGPFGNSDFDNSGIGNNNDNGLFGPIGPAKASSTAKPVTTPRNLNSASFNNANDDFFMPNNGNDFAGFGK